MATTNREDQDQRDIISDVMRQTAGDIARARFSSMPDPGPSAAALAAAPPIELCYSVDSPPPRPKEVDPLDRILEKCEALFMASPAFDEPVCPADPPAAVQLTDRVSYAAKVAVDPPKHVYQRDAYIPKDIWSGMSYAEKRAHRNGARTAAAKAKGPSPVRGEKNESLINEALVAEAAKEAGEQDYFRDQIKELKKELAGKDEKKAAEAEKAQEEARLLQVSIDRLCSGTKEFREQLTWTRWAIMPTVNKLTSWIGLSDDALRLTWVDGSEQLESIALAGTNPDRAEITRYVDVSLPHTLHPRRMEIHAPIFAELVAAGDYLRDEIAYRSILYRRRGQLPFNYHVGLNRPDLMRDTLELAVMYNDAQSGMLRDRWNDQLHFPLAKIAKFAIIFTAIVLMMFCTLTVLYVSPMSVLRFLTGVGSGLFVNLAQLICLGIYLALRQLSRMTIQGAWLRVRNTVSDVLRRWQTQ